jgi:hypothetical protein
METCFVTAMGFALVTRGREEPLPIAIRSGAVSIVARFFRKIMATIFLIAKGTRVHPSLNVLRHGSQGETPRSGWG